MKKRKKNKNKSVPPEKKENGNKHKQKSSIISQESPSGGTRYYIITPCPCLSSPAFALLRIHYRFAHFLPSATHTHSALPCPFSPTPAYSPPLSPALARSTLAYVQFLFIIISLIFFRHHHTLCPILPLLPYPCLLSLALPCPRPAPPWPPFTLPSSSVCLLFSVIITHSALPCLALLCHQQHTHPCSVLASVHSPVLIRSLFFSLSTAGRV